MCSSPSYHLKDKLLQVFLHHAPEINLDAWKLEINFFIEIRF